VTLLFGSATALCSRSKKWTFLDAITDRSSQIHDLAGLKSLGIVFSRRTLEAHRAYALLSQAIALMHSNLPAPMLCTQHAALFENAAMLL